MYYYPLPLHYTHTHDRGPTGCAVRRRVLCVFFRSRRDSCEPKRTCQPPPVYAAEPDMYYARIGNRRARRGLINRREVHEIFTERGARSGVRDTREETRRDVRGSGPPLKHLGNCRELPPTDCYAIFFPGKIYRTRVHIYILWRTRTNESNPFRRNVQTQVGDTSGTIRPTTKIGYDIHNVGRSLKNVVVRVHVR